MRCSRECVRNGQAHAGGLNLLPQLWTVRGWKQLKESVLTFYKVDLNSSSNEFSQGPSPNGAPQSLQLNQNLGLTFQYPTGEKQILCILCNVKINCKTHFFFPTPQPSRPTLNLQKNQQTKFSLLGKNLQTQTTKQLLEK